MVSICIKVVHKELIFLSLISGEEGSMQQVWVQKICSYDNFLPGYDRDGDEVQQDLARSKGASWMMLSSAERWYRIIESWGNFKVNICNFSVITVPADGLAPKR